jgi:antitoxin Phd
MQINTNQIITMTEANQNFSKAVRIAEERGNAIIFKNNKPAYMIVDLNQPGGLLDLTDDEKIDVVAIRILDKYKEAFKKLAE